MVGRDMLTRVWNEMDLRIDVCRITKGGHIEQLWNYVKELGEFLSIGLRITMICCEFVNVSRTYESPGISFNGLTRVYPKYSGLTQWVINLTTKRVWKLPTSTQLRATWHTDSLYMVVLPPTGTWRYHNCCIDGGTSPECVRYTLVFSWISSPYNRSRRPRDGVDV
jgi:hypothetical protein